MKRVGAQEFTFEALFFAPPSHSTTHHTTPITRTTASHLYNWFADSKRLLTLPRILLATISTAAIPLWLLPQEKALLALGAVVATTILAAHYGNFVLGGVVGDFLGATIQVTEVLVYLVLTADWDAAREAWMPFAILAACAALPILNSRPIVDYSSRLPANCPHSC